jgi:hypothetical protein
MHRTGEGETENTAHGSERASDTDPVIVSEGSAPECEHLSAVQRLTARQEAASRHGRLLAATAAYNLAADTMDDCRAQCADASPYRDVEPLTRFRPDPPRRGLRGVLDRLVGAR